METLAAWILGVLMVIAPPAKVHQKNESLDDVRDRYMLTANSMAHVIATRGPLFKGPGGDVRTAALMTSIMKFESELAKDVAEGSRRGDHGKSYCYMQIMVDGKTNIWGDEEMRSWTGEDLANDWVKCFTVAHEILKISMRGCANMSEGALLSMYTSGKCLPDEKKAQHRWNLAKWITGKFPVAKND